MGNGLVNRVCMDRLLWGGVFAISSVVVVFYPKISPKQVIEAAVDGHYFCLITS